MLTVFSEFKAIKNNMAKIVGVSGYKNEYIARKIGMSAQNFAVKKQRGTWTPDELEKIVEVLTKPNEDVENALMLEIMRSRKDDETIPYDEHKKIVNKWK